MRVGLASITYLILAFTSPFIFKGYFLRTPYKVSTTFSRREPNSPDMPFSNLLEAIARSLRKIIKKAACFIRSSIISSSLMKS